MPRRILHGVDDFGTQKATRVEDYYRVMYALGFR
jgi:hypothetical protein